MSKYTPGNYFVYLFDRMGTKIGDRAANGVLEGQAQGDAAISRGEAHSHVVVRVISNSAMVERERYDFKTRWGDR